VKTRQERPPGFLYRPANAASASLYCEQIPLDELSGRFGTPLYVYSERALRERVKAFQNSFRGYPHTLCYSVKANSNLNILKILSQMGCGFDVVSGGELERILQVEKSAASRVVYSGVGKTRAEITAALRAGILLFNAESESELELLGECASRLRKPASIALRVNPDVSARTHAYISTGLHRHKFGVPIHEAARLYAQAAKMKFLRVAGVSVHIGSQISQMDPFRTTLEKVARVVIELRAQGHAIEFVDAGGGLGISYEGKDRLPFDRQVRTYARAILAPLRKLQVHLLLEPGRAIVAPAGILLTRVLYRKKNGNKKFVIVDAAMNDLLRPSLYDAYHEIVPATLASGRKNETVDVVGPVCESGDFLARDRKLPEINEGDLLTVFDVGAYGMSLASNYNSRLRPAEVLVEGKSAKLIRRRETTTDLLRTEVR
jgi:diaminopimelate decarboxylase